MLRLPAWLIRRMIGSDRAGILTEGQNVRPDRTIASGYRFAYPDLDSALDQLSAALDYLESNDNLDSGLSRGSALADRGARST